MPTTKTSNETALKQWVSADGRKLASLVRAGAFFRLVEETQVWEPPQSDYLEGYWYWVETHRSGLYQTAREADAEAAALLAWIAGAEER